MVSFNIIFFISDIDDMKSEILDLKVEIEQLKTENKQLKENLKVAFGVLQ